VICFSSVLAECIVFMLLFLLHVLGYFDFHVKIKLFLKISGFHGTTAKIILFHLRSDV